MSRSLINHEQNPLTHRAPAALTETAAPTFYTHKLAEGRAVLAPMAGFTDAPFRQLCRRFGSGWAVTEMVSAKALLQGAGSRSARPTGANPTW